LTIQCPICSLQVSDPSICAQCGKFGHPICIQLQHFDSYPFCGNCMRIITIQMSDMHDAEQKLDWCLRADTQLVQWKKLARDAIGVSTSIGQAVGGAAALATGALSAVTHGIMQGAKSATIKNSVQPPPEPEPSTLDVRRQRRANSAGDNPRANLTGCDACDYRKHVAHTYSGTCRGIPQTAFFRTGRKDSRAALTTSISGEETAPGPSQLAVESEARGSTDTQPLAYVNIHPSPKRPPDLPRPLEDDRILEPPNSFGTAGSAAGSAELGRGVRSFYPGTPPGSGKRDHHQQWLSPSRR
jgi:hypothetical protein